MSYDQKAARIKEYLFNNDEQIEIVNGVEHYERTPEGMTTTARVAYDKIIEAVEAKPPVDWIIHDGLGSLHEICEMTMRGEFKLKPFEGIKERTVWKYRRVLLANVHRKSLECAIKGVVYTTFVGYEDMEVEDGEVITRRMAPKYFDAIEEETDTVFLTSIKDTKEGSKFLVKVITSKVPKWKTGEVRDVTITLP